MLFDIFNSISAYAVAYFSIVLYKTSFVEDDKRVIVTVTHFEGRDGENYPFPSNVIYFVER